MDRRQFISSSSAATAAASAAAAQPSRASSLSSQSVAFVPGAPLPEEDLEGDPPPVDEAGSKINLARAFIEMGHHDAAILELQAALRMGDETFISH